ncbi:hypothetical protein [Bdellovibrio sp. HCB2-146]|uniref:hypothetical protein n=1 Tax=Bdellovibrio sp. HCB2-146 TaxID=3394362 RepID=UPI0039BC866E
MKNTVAITVAVLLTTSSAFAGFATEGSKFQIPICQPATARPEVVRLLKPEAVRKILEDAEASLGRQRLSETLGKPTLEILQNYSERVVPGSQNNIAAAVASAAVGGAVAKVVEYTWNKYVGNGGKDSVILTKDDYFDLEVSKLQTLVKKRDDFGGNPQALTPAALVVAEAAAAAAGYKAAEYALNRWTRGDAKGFDVREINPTEFDIRATDYRYYDRN